MERRSRLSSFSPSIKAKGVFSYHGNPGETLIYSYQVQWNSEEREYTWEIHKTREELESLQKDIDEVLRNRRSDLVTPLMTQDAFIKLTKIEQLSAGERYLCGLAIRRDVCHLPLFLSFLEVSILSFDGASNKHKEGYILKRTGGRLTNESRVCNCSRYFRRLQRRWLIIRDTMVGYMEHNMSDVLLESLLFKGRFKVFAGREATGYSDGLRLETTQRSFTFRAGSDLLMREWQEAILQAYSQSEWSAANHPNFSSFPVRPSNDVQWFIDGNDYFQSVFDALIHAKKEVFISDWWLSPEVYLKRPPEDYPESQLLELLGQLADAGVSVRICIYKELKLAIGLNSLHTKRALKRRNPKIQVLRHPCRSMVGGEFLWTHHEKIVCVDQETAFFGGLDLCFGRWDTPEHRLFDSHTHPMWPGIDFNNCFVCDFIDVDEHTRDSVDRRKVPRMPWHDVGFRVRGKIASDVALHFIELWNHVMTDITGAYHKSKDLLQPGGDEHSFTPILEVIPSEHYCESRMNHSADMDLDSELSEFKHTLYPPVRENMRRHTFHSSPKHIDLDSLQHIQIHSSGKEKVSPIVLDSISLEAKTPLIHHNGELSPHQGVFHADVDLLPIIHPCKLRFESPRYKTQEEEEEHEHLEMVEEMEEKEAILMAEKDSNPDILLIPLQKSRDSVGTCECQLVRSGGLWSLGLESEEVSIHAAYLNIIDQADFFLYIENQFFISSSAGVPVKNQIAQALVERIKVAAANHDPFKVIVVLPLLPAFEGAIDDPAAAVLRIELYWEYQTISRGVNSILAQLRADPLIEDPLRYIQFYGLRTHALSPDGVPNTELVYVHTKLIIADDDTVLIGSANINDRSLLGCNDSEVAVIYKEGRGQRQEKDRNETSGI